MNVTDTFDSLSDLLEAAETPDTGELSEILKRLIANIEVSHARLAQRIHHLEERIEVLEKAG
jgi:hypothetical protein